MGVGVGAGVASGGYIIGYSGADPVSGQTVLSSELVKATPAEVAEYLKRYNELDGDDKEKNGQQAARSGENDAAAAGSSSSAATNNAARGNNENAHGADARDKNGE
ncbi:unnamed protein product, partial [Laminaria digitata]